MKLLDTLSIETSLKNKVNDLIITNKVIFSDKWKRFNGVYNLALALVKAEKTHEKYKEMGICDEIFFDTMKDIEYWTNNSSKCGLENYKWFENHINMNLFKIGRLQFQMYKCSNVVFNYKKLPFSFGDNVVYIHIPQGEKLDFESCQNSIKKATEFFAKYFPNFQYDYYMSESWLLFDKNKEFMKSNSNIIKFQSLFDFCYNINDSSQAKERIFGNKKFKNMFDSETSLQKSARQYLKHNKLGIGVGVIKK